MILNTIYVNAHAKIVINDTIVHEFGKNTNLVSVETHNDSNHIGSTCEIVFPQNIRLPYQNNSAQSPTYDNQNPQIDYSQSNKGYINAQSRYLFNTGDSIQVFAKYEGYENDKYANSDGYLPIFNGFLFDFYESTPLKIKCLDYIYWFNIGIYGQNINESIGGIPIPGTAKGSGVSFKSVQFKTLLQDLIDTVNITIQSWNKENGTSYPICSLIQPIFDMPLVNISFTQMSPAAVLEWFKKELGLNITILGNKLYVNIASNTTNIVVLQTDKNVINSGLQTTNLQHKKLKGANSVFLRIKLKAYFLKDNGTKDSLEIGDENGQMREVYFYNIKPDTILIDIGNDKTAPKNYVEMANNALDKFHQDRYTGEIETLLYPYCELFWKVKYFDIKYPERNGNYVVTLIKHTLGEGGFHKHLKLAFLDDQNG
jgi:hypothetical protein